MSETHVKIKLKPWQTPNYAIGDMPQATVTFTLGEIDAEALSEMCDAFRAEIFLKAKKLDPKGNFSSVRSK